MVGQWLLLLLLLLLLCFVLALVLRLREQTDKLVKQEKPKISDARLTFSNLLPMSARTREVNESTDQAQYLRLHV